jgi:hypothetical protein
VPRELTPGPLFRCAEAHPTATAQSTPRSCRVDCVVASRSADHGENSRMDLPVGNIFYLSFPGRGGNLGMVEDCLRHDESEALGMCEDCLSAAHAQEGKRVV